MLLHSVVKAIQPLTKRIPLPAPAKMISNSMKRVEKEEQVCVQNICVSTATILPKDTGTQIEKCSKYEDIQKTQRSLVISISTISCPQIYKCFNFFSASYN